MLANIKKFLNDLFTEYDGTSFCVGRVIGFAAFCTMDYKFIVASTTDYISFAGGVSAIIAAVAYKNYTEGKNTHA